MINALGMRRDGWVIRTVGIVAVGNEVLVGEVINTNGAYLASRLSAYGASPTLQMVVGDAREPLLNALKVATTQCDLVITIGGLGPTHDDMTVATVAEFVGSHLIQDVELTQAIRARHSRQPGWEASVTKQSMIIEGAQVWPNSAGTAPGQLVTGTFGAIVLLPGPPRELKAVVHESLEPWMREQTGRAVVRDTYTVFDMGESTVAHYLAPLLTGQHPRTGIYASPGRIDVRFEDIAPAGARSTVATRRAAAWARGLLPQKFYRLADKDRAAYLLFALESQHLTVATMESITGGLVADRFISEPGASTTLIGGVIAYTDAIKIQAGVSETLLRDCGAVSREVARAMAEAITRETGADLGIATTGYAGPTGGDQANPIGTYYVAINGPKGLTERHRQAHSNRNGVRLAAVETALTLLWEYLDLPLEIEE